MIALKGGGGGGGELKFKRGRKKNMVHRHSENRWGFETSMACCQRICFPDCGKAFQNFGAELEKALKPTVFFSFLFYLSFFQQHLNLTQSLAEEH